MLNADLKELFQFGETIIKLRNDVNFRENQQAVRFAVMPVLKSMKTLVPVGTRNNVGLTKTGRSKTYDRGGATKRDLRIKAVTSKNNINEANIIVGVSKSINAVGWRTRFLIHGTKKMAKNDFMIKALNENLSAIPIRYEQKMRKIINKRLIK